MAHDNNGLIELHLETPATGARDEIAANGAPAREPDVWDERIADFNPLLAHTPEAEPLQVSPAFAAQNFSVEDYLAEERAKDLLRFSTAGSVDDGKSTLIGRLLYDTQSVYDDQLSSIEGKGTTAPGVLDLALLTDGLRAEREQGITIDVAYRYFATSRRKFIIADTPGHEQYTRNMATGASTSDAAIILVDARKGVLPQSRRHAAITSLLGVRHLIIAVNKMDLVHYDEATFRTIKQEFCNFVAELGSHGIEFAATLHFIPVSALAGDNVVHPSTNMPWYTGPALLDLLETIPSLESADSAPFRMAVQRVVRPDLDFRGFAGQIASGTIRPGDTILALPSGRASLVTRIVTFNGDLAEASAPLSVTLTLADEIDISRGDLLTSATAPARVTTAFTAALVWMHETPLALNRRLLLKHTSRTVQAEVCELLGTIQLAEAATLTAHTAAPLAMNGIGLVTIDTLLPLALDTYADNRHTGSFVLIDPQTNATVAAGMIRIITDSATAHDQPLSNTGRVHADERLARFGHTGAHLILHSPTALAEDLERTLFAQGANTILLDGAESPAIAALLVAGLLVLTHEPSDNTATIALPGRPAQLINSPEAALNYLRQHGVLVSRETVRKELA